jgi:hypothetical protein
MRKTMLLLAGGLLAAGCSAGFYLVGATPYKGAPPSPTATWRITACTMANGSTVAGPTATYYLDQSGFYEVEANGAGAQITNTWSDDKGTYFFTRVKTNNGWLYFLPKDTTQPAVRTIFTKGSYSIDDSGGVMKPIGTPAATCLMTPA